MARKLITRYMDRVNINSTKQNHLWKMIHGGTKNVSCLTTDLDNFRWDESVIIDNHDCGILMMRRSKK